MTFELNHPFHNRIRNQTVQVRLFLLAPAVNAGSSKSIFSPIKRMWLGYDQQGRR